VFVFLLCFVVFLLVLCFCLFCFCFKSQTTSTKTGKRRLVSRLRVSTKATPFCHLSLQRVIQFNAPEWGPAAMPCHAMSDRCTRRMRAQRFHTHMCTDQVCSLGFSSHVLQNGRGGRPNERTNIHTHALNFSEARYRY
jgi:hypothetical protein